MNKPILLLSILLLVGCVSKKKTIEEEKQKTELTTETEKEVVETEIKKEEETTVKKTDSLAEKDVKTITTTKDQELDIEADSTGVVTVTEETTGNTTKRTFTGVKNLSVRDKTKNEETTLRERIRTLKTDSTHLAKTDSIYRASKEKEIATLKQEYESRLKTKDEDIGNGWFWWFIGSLGLNIILILYINRKRIKRFTPF
jgi:PBP1b-binding outer membrane lipoprotein LpoB